MGNRQSHLAALFAEDSTIVFGEGDPSEEQQQEGIPYAKVFNHRVYHLEINPNIILMQLANSFDISVEIHYENALTKNEPSCFVIIDNREGLRTVAIQNRRKAFPAPKRVAEILTEKLNRVLYGDYCYSLEILPKYYPEDLFQAWGKLQNVTRDMLFNVPDMSREEMLKRVADFKNRGEIILMIRSCPHYYLWRWQPKRANIISCSKLITRIDILLFILTKAAYT